VTEPGQGTDLDWFDYDNRTGRPTGRALRVLGRVLPGVAQVQAQVTPYADAWRAHNLAALAGTRRRWVVLGDSMSQGVGASAYDRGWVGQLRDRLAEDGHPLDVVNLSATGARTRDLLEVQLPLLEALPPRAGRPADLVTVLVGSNDLFGGGEHRDGLPRAFATLVDLLPHGAVVATLPQPSDAARRANEHVERAAVAGRIRVVDMRASGPRSWRGRLAADRFHPNDAGYAALADAFEPAVRQALAG
jgi:lysophospholipase L1-like esterase